MSAFTSEGVKSSLTCDETFSLGSKEVRDVGNAAIISSEPISSEEVAQQIETATHPLTKQMEKLRDLKRELLRDTSRRVEVKNCTTIAER